MKHLHTGGAPPDEYLELYLCRDVYRCRPSELDEEDAERITKHLVCLGVEGELQRFRSLR